MKIPGIFLAFGHGWRFWLVVILGLLFVVVFFVMLLFNRWINDQSDLAGVDARARSMAIPITWGEAALKVAPSERIDLWRDIAKTVVNLPAWKDDHDHPTLIIGVPFPDSLLAHHNRLDSREMQHLLKCIDALGPDQVVFRSEFNENTPMPEMKTYKDVVELLSQRVLLATKDHLVDECRRVCEFIHTLQVSTKISELTQISVVNTALNGITRRLPDLKSIPQSGQCSKMVLDLASCISAGETQVWRLGFIQDRSCIGNLRNGLFATMVPKADHAPWYWRILEMTFIKYTRVEAFDRYLDYLEFRRNNPSTVDLLAENHRLESTITKFHDKHQGRQSTMLYGFFMMVCEELGRFSRITVLHAQVIAAEMSGQPWPIDDFSGGAKSLLTKVIVDGRLIGAASCKLEKSTDSPYYQPLAWGLYGSVKQWRKEHRVREGELHIKE